LNPTQTLPSSTPQQQLAARCRSSPGRRDPKLPRASPRATAESNSHRFTGCCWGGLLRVRFRGEWAMNLSYRPSGNGWETTNCYR